MKIWSWNINGLRAAAKKGFGAWLDERGERDIVCVQEVRALPEQLPNGVRNPEGWWSHFVAAERKGYSGVGAYARRAADEVRTSLGEERFDVEGRLQWLRWGDLHVVNGYFPNGSGPNRDHSRVPYKLDFYRRVYDVLEPLRAAGAPILVLGDFNTAHRPIDLARPKGNKKTSGFLMRERRELGRWLRHGWTDTFRHFHPKQEGAYSWWSQRYGVREKNVGWRIDYVLASPGAMEFVKDAFIAPDVMGSDHCPVGVEFDEAVMG